MYVPHKMYEKKSVRLTSRIQIHYEWSKTQRKEVQRLRNLLLDHSMNLCVREKTSSNRPGQGTVKAWSG